MPSGQDLPATAYWFTYVLPPVRMVDFALGILVALAVKHGRWRNIGMIPSIMLLAGGYWLGYHMPYFYGQRATMIIPIALLIAAAATADIEGRFTLFRNRTMVWLGEISFAFYLLHYIALSRIRKAARHADVLHHGGHRNTGRHGRRHGGAVLAAPPAGRDSARAPVQPLAARSTCACACGRGRLITCQTTGLAGYESGGAPLSRSCAPPLMKRNLRLGAPTSAQQRLDSRDECGGRWHTSDGPAQSRIRGQHPTAVDQLGDVEGKPQYAGDARQLVVAQATANAAAPGPPPAAPHPRRQHQLGDPEPGSRVHDPFVPALHDNDTALQRHAPGVVIARQQEELQAEALDALGDTAEEPCATQVLRPGPGRYPGDADARLQRPSVSQGAGFPSSS